MVLCGLLRSTDFADMMVMTLKTIAITLMIQIQFRPVIIIQCLKIRVGLSGFAVPHRDFILLIRLLKNLNTINIRRELLIRLHLI